MQITKRAFKIFLAMVLLVTGTCATTASTAEYTATSLRLEKTTGTVTVKNAVGREVDLKAGSRLFNGYEIKTGAKSYAWISLDDSKVLKLDAASEVEIQKKNTDITVYLKSGKLFFDVKKKLSSKENLNIKTSTMVTGIRGTSGMVEVENENRTRLQLYDGTITMITYFAQSDKMEKATIQAGQTAYALVGKDATDKLAEVRVETLAESDIPGFAAVEIKEDKALQERIEEETELKIEEIVQSAEAKQAEDEKLLEEKERQIEEERAAVVKEEKVDPVFGEEEGSEGSSDSSGGITWYPIPSPDPDPSPSPSPSPSESPSPEPSESPDPTATPSQDPTATPSEDPTATPSQDPTATPSEDPTATPSQDPTATPSQDPTASP